MTTPPYSLLWRPDDPSAAFIGKSPEEISVWPYLAEGTSTRGRIQDTIPLYLSSRIGGKKLLDLVGNALGFLIVSPKVRAILSDHMPAEAFEVSRVAIHDHRKMLVPIEYSVINVLGTVDAMDHARSQFTRLDADELLTVKRLCLDPARLDPTRSIFRLKEKPPLHLVRDDLRAALDAAHVTGMLFLPLDTDIDVY